MTEEPDKVTEALFLDKDQVDCLLIVLTDQMEFRKFKMEAVDKDKPRIVEVVSKHLVLSQDEAIKAVEEQYALDVSLLNTIPTILDELKEMYPYLQERTQKSRIIVPEPTWKKK